MKSYINQLFSWRKNQGAAKFKEESSKNKFPIRALVIGQHHHGASSWSSALLSALIEHPNVKSCGFTDEPLQACMLIKEHDFDTVFFSTLTSEFFAPNSYVIHSLRQLFPHVVFVLFGENHFNKAFVSQNPRYAHYFSIDVEELERGITQTSFDRALLGCIAWHERYSKYDVAISFASEEEVLARDLAGELGERGARVYLYLEEQSDSIGKDLASQIDNIYLDESRYCLALISPSYLKKEWTRKELRLALRRLGRTQSDYLIPYILADTSLPSEITKKCYIPKQNRVAEVAKTISEKLWLNNSLRKDRKLIYVSGANLSESYVVRDLKDKVDTAGAIVAERGFGGFSSHDNSEYDNFFPFYVWDFKDADHLDLKICIGNIRASGISITENSFGAAIECGVRSLLPKKRKYLSDYPNFKRNIMLNRKFTVAEQNIVDGICTVGFKVNHEYLIPEVVA